MTQDTVIIYHSNCLDGSSAAWAFTQAKKFGKDFGKLIFHYTNERCFEKDKSIPILTGKNVYILDYCYPKEILEKINSIANNLTVIDHHKTAVELFDVVPDYCIFDMTKCAAEITWDYLYGKNTRPWFLQHVRDRDLWLWENPNSRAFSAAINEVGLSFKVLDELLVAEPDELYQRGKTILEFDNRLVNKLCKAAELVEFEGYTIYALNTILYISECGNTLCKMGKAKFALLYRYQLKQNEWWISLRGCEENGIDLTLIAKKYGGGGHPLASGFTYKGDIRELFKEIKK
ncbi:oligoribonuclease NrnB [Pacmanvirus S19]|nr:oligoribonuclease NrnB [Pacmanvirus S19]